MATQDPHAEPCDADRAAMLDAAIHYALDVAEDTDTWLRLWRDGDVDAQNDLRLWMAKPPRPAAA